jgi:hypothetical protein
MLSLVFLQCKGHTSLQMMPICLLFSPDKSEKIFKGADYFLLVKKSDQRKLFFYLTKKAAPEKLVTNSWTSSSN